MIERNVCGCKAVAIKTVGQGGMIWEATFVSSKRIKAVGVTPEIAFAHLKRDYLQEEAKHIIHPGGN